MLVLSLKGSPGFRAWFDGLVDYCRISATSVAEKAFIRFAQEVRYEEEPPKR